MTAEDYLQVAVADLLNALEKPWRFSWFHVPNQRGSKTTVGLIMKLKRMGMKKGCPDCHIDREGGQTFKIELKAPKVGKTPKGTLSKEQKELRDRYTELGIPYYVCYTIDEVIAVMEKEFNRKVNG